MFHFRMVFLDSSLIDLVTDCVSVSTPSTVGQVITNLRTLWILRIEGSEPQPVEIHPDGRIKAVGWETFLNRVRTCLPIEIEGEIPDTIYDLNIAK